MNYGQSAFSFGKVLTGISRTLGVANQVIPLYQQTKPLFKNARSAYNVIKDINKNPRSKVKPNPIQKNTPKQSVPALKEKAIITNNSPQFFI